MSNTQIKIEGLKEFRRELNRAQKGLGRALTREIKAAARIIADDARARAERQGLRQTGRLVRGIKPFARGTTGGVRSTAKRDGYPYPNIYEFGGPGRVGDRPFLYPALEAKREEAIRRLLEALDRFL